MLTTTFSITTIIIVVTCIVSFIAFSNARLKNDLLFWPAEIDDRGQYYRFLTYGFVHGDFLHLAFNMMSLYSFGAYVEKYLYTQSHLFGHSAPMMYISLYVLGLIVSTIPDYFYYKNYSSYRALGASGAVCAVIFSGIMLEPKLPISMLFIPVRIPGYIFGVIFIAISIWLGKRGGDNIGHRAHISGAIFGILFTIIAAKLFSNFDVVKSFLDEVLNRY